MNRLFTRRGVMIGASALALAPVVPPIGQATATETQSGSDSDTSNGGSVALTAFGDLQLPCIYLGNERAIARTRDINCRIYLGRQGKLSIDNLDYSDYGFSIQLTPDQHAELLAAFTGYAGDHIFEREFREVVQPKGGQS